jgi:DNA polymerase elongation subunit (family B)
MVDTLVVMKKAYPNDKSHTLASMLAKLKLPAKDDMNVHRMFKIIEAKVRANTSTDEQTLRTINSDMYQVIKYCVQDTMVLSGLWRSRCVIEESLATASLSHVCLSNVMFRAGSNKVINLAMYNAEKREAGQCILFSKYKSSQRSMEKTEKFPGADVRTPIRGRTLREIGALDFESMYPSILIADNLSPEKIVHNNGPMDVQKRDNLVQLGYNLREINVQMPSGLVHRGWSVWHDNSEERMGIFPKICRTMFQMRKQMKVRLREIEDAVEAEKRRCDAYDQKHAARDGHADKHADNTTDAGVDEDARARAAALRKNLTNAKFKYSIADAEQRALKILMNTVYGTTGSLVSPLFDILIAGGVTTRGQKCIKLAHKIVINNGFTIYYGDTDSIYLAAPKSIYAHLTRPKCPKDDDFDNTIGSDDRERYLDYREKRVACATDATIALGGIINKAMFEYLGSGALNMAFEEVGCPTSMQGKKKYVLKVHKKGIADYRTNLHKPLIRGIESVKRTATGFLKHFSEMIITQMLDIFMTDSLEQLIVNTLYEAWQYLTTNVDNFARSLAYRPQNKNVSVLRFVERMRERKLPIPDGGSRFDAVRVIPKAAIYDYRGCAVKQTAGDCLEYLSVVKENPEEYKIDKVYYMREIVTLLARVLTYRYPNSGDEEAVTLGKSALFNAMENFSGAKLERTRMLKFAKSAFSAARAYVIGRISTMYGDSFAQLIKKFNAKNSVVDVEDEDTDTVIVPSPYALECVSMYDRDEKARERDFDKYISTSVVYHSGARRETRYVSYMKYVAIEKAKIDKELTKCGLRKLDEFMKDYMIAVERSAGSFDMYNVDALNATRAERDLMIDGFMKQYNTVKGLIDRRIDLTQMSADQCYIARAFCRYSMQKQLRLAH